ncbi:MAG: hypothetical protein Q8839_02475 [Candidatus Phytoplasma australasiaticum]|nr:hypothetical protein [Candidatus Phytoplasma australasiaticum]
MNQCQKGILPKNTIQNPKNKRQYMVVTTRGGKSTIDPPMLIEVEDVCEKIVADKDVVERDDCVRDGMTEVAKEP